MKLNLYGSWVLMLAFVIISGCTSEDVNTIVDSPGVSTNSMSAEMHVSYSGGQTVSIEVMLREGPINSTTDINLISGDTLKSSTMGNPSNLNFDDNLFDNLVEMSNQVKTLNQGTRRIYHNIISGIWYFTAIDAKYRNKEFTVSLLRDKRNDAPNSTVYLPPDFRVSIDELKTTSILSRSGPITLRWSPINPGYSMEIDGFVNCSDNTTGKWSSTLFESSSASFEIPAGTFTGYIGDCIITLGVESITLGSTDPALHPSSVIRGHQYRTIAIATME